MQARDQSTYPLLRQFREFYAEVARLRRMAEAQDSDGVGAREVMEPVAAGVGASGAGSGLSGATANVSAGSGQGDDGVMVLKVWSEMARSLDQKMYEVRASSSSFFHDLQEELVYLMAAFADETFVCLLAWPGRAYWAEHLMEQRLFRTQVAGQEIYRRIDALLGKQDFGTEELAMVYLMVLALGFRGRFLRDTAAVNGYRKRLFERLALANPDLKRQSPRLFPEAYLHTIVEGAPVRLPEPRRWWLTVAGVVGVWLVLSSIAWFVLTNSTRELTATTMQSLQRIGKEQALAAGNAGKWRVAAFPPQAGKFSVSVPAGLSSVRDGGRVATTVMVGVQGVNGASAGSAGRLQNWLAHGTVEAASQAEGTTAGRKPVVSVMPASAPPQGVAGGDSAQYFLLELDVPAGGPKLTFPEAGDYGLDVGSVMLVTPDEPQADTPGGQ